MNEQRQPNTHASVMGLLQLLAWNTTPFFVDVPGEVYFSLWCMFWSLMSSLVVYAIGCHAGTYPDFWGAYAALYILLCVRICWLRRYREAKGIWIHPRYCGRRRFVPRLVDEPKAGLLDAAIRLAVGIGIFYLLHPPLGFMVSVSAVAERMCQLNVAEYRRRIVRDMIGNEEWNEGIMEEFQDTQRHRGR